MLAQKMTSLKKSSLSSAYAEDMTAKSYSPMIGRKAELQRVLEILTRKSKANPILVGEPGVGKTAIIQGLSELLKTNNAPDHLRNRKLYSIDLSILGKDIEAIKYVLEEVIANGDIVFIDEIHNIVGAGRSSGSLDVANVMKPLLTSGSLMCIGATTPEEYMKYFEKDSALERRFSRVNVEEPDYEDCLEMLEKVAPSYETHHKVKLSKESLESAIKLSKRYITDKQLPDKAFDLIDEACAKKNLDLSQRKKLQEDLLLYEKNSDWEKVSEIKYSLLPSLESLSETVEANDVARVVAKKTAIPVEKIGESEKEKLLNLESILKKKIIGQNSALGIIADQIRSSRLGIRSSNTSFLFLGSSGVGKTEVAKALSQYLFDNETSLLRFDMSEFQEKHSVSKLIGAPAGYVGYENGGRLTESVRRRPFQVILFDEVEKAHPDIYDTLLQVLDEGVLTDSMGRRVDFKNTIIIMTSNLTQDNLKKFFRTEFINRINDIIQFESLSRNDLEKIAYCKLIDLASKIKEENDILIDFSRPLVEKIVDLAYKPEYGARELNRIIDKLIKIPLTNKILKGELEKDRLFIFQ